MADLSQDLYNMYETPLDYRSEGAGDTPESVNKALHDAVYHISWGQDSSAHQVIFLLGDAPSHMDYANEVHYPEIAAEDSLDH